MRAASCESRGGLFRSADGEQGEIDGEGQKDRCMTEIARQEFAKQREASTNDNRGDDEGSPRLHAEQPPDDGNDEGSCVCSQCHEQHVQN